MKKYIITALFLIICSAFFVRVRYISHMEEKILAKPLRYEKDSVSLQDYSSGYGAIATATGNYISGIAALLTLTLLAFQYREMKKSETRYSDDKTRSKIEFEKNETHRFIEMIDRKISEIKFGQEKERIGLNAINKINGLLSMAIEERKKLHQENLSKRNSTHQEKFEDFNKDLHAILLLSTCLLRNSEKYEAQSKAYMKEVFTSICEYKFLECAKRTLEWASIPSADNPKEELANAISTYFDIRSRIIKES